MILWKLQTDAIDMASLTIQVRMHMHNKTLMLSTMSRTIFYFFLVN